VRIPDETYQTILSVIPIPCVDLVISKSTGEVLLVRRTNEPARGEWWFPGGRVHFGETREAAATRKLAEECGLSTADARELWTLDVILPVKTESRISHGITTVFAAFVPSESQINLDAQASEFSWKRPTAWQRENLHPLVHEVLSRFAKMVSQNESAIGLTA